MKIPWSKRWRLNREYVKINQKLKPYLELQYHLSNALALSRRVAPESGNRIAGIITDIKKPISVLSSRKESIKQRLNVKTQSE